MTVYTVFDFLIAAGCVLQGGLQIYLATITPNQLETGSHEQISKAAKNTKRFAYFVFLFAFISEII